MSSNLPHPPYPYPLCPGSYLKSESAGYMHVYFNATRNTAKMWLLSAIALLLVYEACKHVMWLICQHRTRPHWLVCAGIAIYPNYYGFWNLFK